MIHLGKTPIIYENERTHTVVMQNSQGYETTVMVNAKQIVPHGEGTGVSFLDAGGKLLLIVDMEHVKQIHFD